MSAPIYLLTLMRLDYVHLDLPSSGVDTYTGSILDVTGPSSGVVTPQGGGGVIDTYADDGVVV